MERAGFNYIYTMCGIAGIISPQLLKGREENRFLLNQQLQKMTDAIAHRGPDGEGYWINEKGIVGLGHRRLSIIDLSEKAAQPMHYLSRYTITYNGEIYNYIELKQTLQQKGYHFISQSDTEVILAAYDCWKENCLLQFDGMFAFVIWDEKEQTLFAARDRFGEKPFYYFKNGENFLFASEMKALWAAGVPKQTNGLMLLNYLSLGTVQNSADASLSFYKNIFQLPAANYLTLCNSELTIQPYWDLDKETISPISEIEAVEKFQFLFQSSVSKRLRSDVAIGTSLSGGLDSSSVAAVIHQLQKNKLQTFSAVFPGYEKDESAYISKTVSAFGLGNFSVTPSAAGFIDDFEKLCYHQEEPFQSASIYAQYKVFQLAKKHGIKVLLDGQGADEILAGYHKYYHWYWQQLYRTNKKKLNAEQKETAALGINPSWGFKNKLAARLPLLAAVQLENKDIRSIKNHPDINRDFIAAHYDKFYSVNRIPVEKLNDILYYNTMQNGLGELLRYADRNSMAHGVEVRLPFLNHELVQFIFSLPVTFKINNGWTKWLLRQGMKTVLPNEIVWRKDKVGYEPPQLQWMQPPQMQEYIQEARKKLVAKGILKNTVLDKPFIAKSSHDADNYDWRYLCSAMVV
jgi:asparagine synthase (glutamine-hydrolysing)